MQVVSDWKRFDGYSSVGTGEERKPALCTALDSNSVKQLIFFSGIFNGKLK